MLRSTFAVLNETSKPAELLLLLTRDRSRPLATQIEDQLRRAIRTGALRPEARLPSTRELARQLAISRGVVVSAYAQLGAEGYLLLEQGRSPRVSGATSLGTNSAEAELPVARPRFDFRPGVPDVSLFPRGIWLRSLRAALSAMPDPELGYGDPRGVDRLHTALAEYLGRVRGVVANPGSIVITSGYAQGLSLICRALAATGARRIAIENPSHPEQRLIALRAGLELVPIRVDEAGLRIDELERTDVGAAIVTPAHQFPSGTVLAAERRTALLAWLRERDAVLIEDDYDAEYRYDRAPIGALQGLEPDRVVYGGSVSKTLAPALRIGWLVLPPRLLDAVAEEKRLADISTARIEQYAFADFLARGELDRHLRRMRSHYRQRRDALVETLATVLPEAVVEGIAGGLHAAVRLTETDDERAIADEARRRRIAIATMSDHLLDLDGPPTLVLGYAQSTEPAIRLGITELAEAVRETRRQLRAGVRSQKPR